MKEQTQALEHASVKQYCKALRVPMIGAHFVQLAEQAIKEQRSHIGYLQALLTMESEERDRHAIQQRLRDAKLPRLKTFGNATALKNRSSACRKPKRSANISNKVLPGWESIGSPALKSARWI